MPSDLLTLLTEFKAGLQAYYGARLHKLVLFGSQARGDADAGSDVDLLVVLTGSVSAITEIERTGDLVAGISLRHHRVIACLFQSESDFHSRNTPLLVNVRREGIAL